MKKRFLAVVLALALCAGLAPAAFAGGGALSPDEETNTGDVTYPVQGGNIYFNSSTGAVVRCDKSVTAANIPDAINGVKVTRIGATAFLFCESLTNVTIPKGVTEIAQFAFGGCTNLTGIDIPDGVTSIGDSAFEGCENLTSVTIPSSVTSIGSSIFFYCKSLTSVTIPSGVTDIGDSTFYHCESLTSVTIPSSVTNIGGTAFEFCYSLTSVTIPSGVTSIESGTFSGCKSLTSVTIPNSVTGIGRHAFYGCKNLASVTIPNSVTSIGTQAFYGCENLTSVTIPEGITSIEDYTFGNCYSLTSVTIPSGVTSIGEGAFSFCKSLTSVTIPSGVTSIEKDTFFNCKSLTSVTIPSSVASIGEAAFSQCESLTSVTIPSSVASIGENAFYYCKSLADVYYGGSEVQWKTINIEGGNSLLDEAAIHYNSARAKFSDVKFNGFYVDAVEWALANNITTGKTENTFAPNLRCSHSEILTFLWRAAGKPMVDVQTPFAAEGFYADAARWAYAKGLIGADFNPKAPCTRADAVNYIWQAAGKGAASYDGRFTDVPANSPYATAVAWAVENGVTTGTSATRFTPNRVCDRSTIVTFLYRYFGK